MRYLCIYIYGGVYTGPHMFFVSEVARAFEVRQKYNGVTNGFCLLFSRRAAPVWSRHCVLRQSLAQEMKATVTVHYTH